MRQKFLVVDFQIGFCVCSLILSSFLFCVPTHAQSSGDVPANGIRSSISAAGSGTVKLEPTILRLSIPIRAVSDASWDAVESLRNSRRSIEERANEMGALEGSLRVFGFQVAPELPTSISIRGGSPTPKFSARCNLVADFPLRSGQDHEETVGLCQQQLEQLTSLLPEVPAGRRSYSVSSMASGLTSQQLERPLALFVAKVSTEDRAKAFKDAFELANDQVEMTLEALGIEVTSISITQTPNFSSVRTSSRLESVLKRDPQNEAISVYADAVEYNVRLMVSGQFRKGE